MCAKDHSAVAASATSAHLASVPPPQPLRNRAAVGAALEVVVVTVAALEVVTALVMVVALEVIVVSLEEVVPMVWCGSIGGSGSDGNGGNR